MTAESTPPDSPTTTRSPGSASTSAVWGSLTTAIIRSAAARTAARQSLHPPAARRDRIADRHKGGRIDDDAVEILAEFIKERLERLAGEEFGGVGRPTARRDQKQILGELGAEDHFLERRAEGEDIGEPFRFATVSEDLTLDGSAHVGVDQKGPVALQGERMGKVRGNPAFAFAGDRTGDEKGATFLGGAEKGQPGPQRAYGL